jgi:tetratricopeptide (TPR) repeat protein
LWEKEESLIAEPEKKKEIFFTIGDILEQKLDSRDEAAGNYEKSLEIDPEYLASVKPLAEIYYDSGVWEKARPLYAIWSKDAEAEGVDKAAEIFYREGWIAEQLQDVDNALQKYLRSSEVKSVYLPPLERLSEIYLSQENFAEAETYLERVLELEKERQDNERIFEVLIRLGEIEVKLEKADAAIGRYEDALAIKAGDYQTLRSIIPLYFGKEDWQKLLNAYDLSIQSAPEPELQASGLVEKGDVLEKHLKQPESATAHYRKAVQIKPDYLSGWEHLGEVYVDQKNWPEAIESIEKLIELEPSVEKRTEYNCQLGKVYQDGLNDLDQASQYFEAALALDETHVPSMEAIGMIYLRQKQWQKYIDVTDRFVKLIPKDEQEKAIPLYMRRGEVFRDFLENKEKAIIEFQNVTRIQSEHEEARSSLASLYLSDKNFYNNAIKENLILLRQKPFRIQSYRDLGKIYEGLNKLDEAFCIYSVLDVLKSINPQERMFFEAHQPQIIKESKRALNDEGHEKVLVHPDERGPLHDMLVLMGDYMEKIFPPQLEKLGAKKNFKAQPDTPSPIKKLVDELAVNIGIAEYDLYLIPTQTEPRVANTNPPSLILNQEWFNKFKPEERRFIIAKWLEHLKGRHALVFNFSADKVVQTLFLLAKIFKSEIEVPGMDEKQAQSEMKSLKRAVPRKIRNQMEQAAVSVASGSSNVDVNKWQQGMIHSGNRAGLLLTNDLPLSISAMMKLHPQFKNMRFDELGDPIPILEQCDDALEMLMFAVSDAYFTLRRRTGFSLLSI